MPQPRSYQQFCPMAAALDAVGDRWALLLVRELMLGPRRFVDLENGLPGIGTDILTARLRGLEAEGVLRRRGEGRARRYELTPRGRALRHVLAELARWGSERLQLGGADGLAPRVGLTALLLDPEPVPAAADGDYEISAGGETARVAVLDGRLELDAGAEPGTRIDLTGAALRALLIGVPAEQLASAGEISVNGDAPAALQLLDALAGPRLLDGLRRQYLDAERRDGRSQRPAPGDQVSGSSSSATP